MLVTQSLGRRGPIPQRGNGGSEQAAALPVTTQLVSSRARHESRPHSKAEVPTLLWAWLLEKSYKAPLSSDSVSSSVKACLLVSAFPRVTPLHPRC